MFCPYPQILLRLKASVRGPEDLVGSVPDSLTHNIKVTIWRWTQRAIQPGMRGCSVEETPCHSESEPVSFACQLSATSIANICTY
jgi:hypothetical protein